MRSSVNGKQWFQHRLDRSGLALWGDDPTGHPVPDPAAVGAVDQV
jgi:hypothetical protein